MAETHKNQDFVKYKFKELKIYSSTEWLADNRKKYRQVFDRYQTAYIYAELSFYNKYFDVKVWEVNITFRCFGVKDGKKEICNLDFKKKVSKYDNVVYVREGWGNKKYGAFWKEGSYYWEAYIEDQLVATKYFYIEDVGINLEKDNIPYFSTKSIKLYEGQFDDVIAAERKYFKTFAAEDTRYIHTEITLENLHDDKDWHCELFINFYNEARELKGRITRLISVKAGTDFINTTAGWGSNTPGTWRKGKYSVEVVFLDKMIASVDFALEDDFEEGVPKAILPYDKKVIPESRGEIDQLSFDKVIEKLDRLVGLHEIKQKVRDHAQYIKFLRIRMNKGFEENEMLNIHSVFTGNPGTGKTTVAKMMGKIYAKMGLLTKGHVHEVDRVDLVGEYIGQTAPKVKEAIDKAKGGVLFIDEAYALTRNNDDSKDFGREVIEILVKEMSNPENEFAVIVAGYPKEMKNFINSNPGLKSRFKHYFEFKDYLPQELIEIANISAEDKGIKFDPAAMELLEDMITEEYRRRDKSFGNARFVNDLLDKAKINLGIRIMKRKNPYNLTSTELMTVKISDVKNISLEKNKVIPNIPVDEKMLALALEEMNSLIGIQNVKEQLQELVDIVKYHRESGRHVINNYSFHSVFVGNPGTGKTTVARILTKIYKALGILERGHMVETDRQGLVAGFIGQTAIKTAERIDEAMGGVLFIDEAYALSNHNGLQGDYGNEAIQTILKRMEDNRGQFFVFAAGYPENMDRFLKANPGLSSRFDKTFIFEDYSAEELFQIAVKMIEDHKMRISPKAKKLLQGILSDLYLKRDKYFGNARTVRKIVLELVKHQNLRYAQLPPSKRSKRTENLITIDDVSDLDVLKEEAVFEKKGIGFRNSKN